MYVADLVGVLQWVFLIGLVVAIVGQVGRRVFADNSCWRCQFDLSGHPGVPDGPFPVVCPECGESIPDAVMLKVDTRTPRVGVRRAGFIMMLAIVPVVVIFVRAGYTLDRYRVATNAGIIGLIGASDYRASEEFERRFAADLFTGAQREEIARKIEAMILAMPQDRLEPGTMRSMMSTTAMWGDVYLAIVDSGDVTKEEAQRLFDSITDFSLAFPPHNRYADPFFCTVRLYGHSVGGANVIANGFDLRITSLSVGDFDLSSMPMTRSDRQLTHDYYAINSQTTLATAWTFSVSSDSFVFPEFLLGTNRVRATLVVESVPHEYQDFTSLLLDRAYDGARTYQLESELVVKPYSDRESTRGFPSLADVISKHGDFVLMYDTTRDFYELTLTIDDQFEIPEDTAIIAQIDKDHVAGEIVGWSKVTFRTDDRRVSVLIADDLGEIDARGGVWVKLDAVEPMPRVQSWRPLVITGDVEPIWVPLDE